MLKITDPLALLVIGFVLIGLTAFNFQGWILAIAATIVFVLALFYFTREYGQELQLNIHESQVNTQTISKDDTQFWVCPHCGGNTQSRNGKQFCSKCNAYL